MKELPSTIDKKLGQKYGKLTVLAFSHYKVRKNSKSRDSYWKCSCDCGSGKMVIVQNSNLLGGNVKSCGCLSKERLRKLHLSNIDDEATCRAVFKVYEQSAKKRKLEFNLSIDEFKKLTQNICAYCGSEPSFVKKHNGKNEYKGKPYIYNGIDRVDNRMGYTIENCVSCCRICNIAKGTMTTKEFLGWLMRAAKFQSSKLVGYESHPAIKGEVAV